MNSIGFKLMALNFWLRDLFQPPKKILEEVGIAPGISILDYGCGPGSFSLAAAEVVGTSGKVYAVDVYPLAVEIVSRKASKKGLTNVMVVQSGCKTGAESSTIDVVFLYDVYHGLSDPVGVLTELHRVLKPDGALSFSDHHMKEEDIISGVTGTGLFTLVKKGKWTYTFLKT